MKTVTITYKVPVNDKEAAKELLRKLMESSEVDAFIQHADFEGENIHNEVANEDILWSFDFIYGGRNSVIAKTLEEAQEKVKRRYEKTALPAVDPKSFKSYRSKTMQNAYFKGII